MSKSAIVEKEATELGTKIATEAIVNIKTVASLSKKIYFHKAQTSYSTLNSFLIIIRTRKVHDYTICE